MEKIQHNLVEETPKTQAPASEQEELLKVLRSVISKKEEILNDRRTSQEAVFQRVEEQTAEFKTYLKSLAIPAESTQIPIEEPPIDFAENWRALPCTLITNNCYDFISSPQDEQIQEWEDKLKTEENERKKDFYRMMIRNAKEIQRSIKNNLQNLDPHLTQKLNYLVTCLKKGNLKLAEWGDDQFCIEQFSQLIERLPQIADQEIYIMGIFMQNGMLYLSDSQRPLEFNRLKQAFSFLPNIQKIEERNVYAEDILFVYAFLEKNNEETLRQIYQKLEILANCDQKKKIQAPRIRDLEKYHPSLLTVFLSIKPEEISNILNKIDGLNQIHLIDCEELCNFLPYFRKHKAEFLALEFNRTNLFPKERDCKNFSQTLFFALHPEISSNLKEDKTIYHLSHRPPEHFQEHALALKKYVLENSPEIGTLCQALQIEEIDFEPYTKNLEDYEPHDCFTRGNKIIQDLRQIADCPPLIKFIETNFTVKNISTLLLISDFVKRNGPDDFAVRTESVRKLTDGHKIDLQKNRTFYLFALERQHSNYTQNIISSAELATYLKISTDQCMNLFAHACNAEIEEDYLIKKYLQHHEFNYSEYFLDRTKESFEDIDQICKSSLYLWHHDKDLYQKAQEIGFLTPEKTSNIFQVKKINRLFSLPNYEKFLAIIDPERKYVFENYKNWNDYFYAYQGNLKGLLNHYQNTHCRLEPDCLETMRQLYPADWTSKCEPEITKYFSDKDHNARLKDVTEGHLYFLQSLFQEDPQFFQNFANQTLLQDKRDRWNNSDIVKFLVDTDPEWADQEALQKAILENLFPLYKDKFYKFIMDKCAIAGEINTTNWTEITILLLENDLYAKKETQARLSGLTDNPANQAFLKKSLEQMCRNIYTDGEKLLTEKEQFLLHKCKANNIEIVHPLNLLTSGEIFTRCCFKDLNLFQPTLELLEKGFEGKLAMTLQTEKKNTEIVNPLETDENQALIQELLQIATDFLEIKFFQYSDPHPNLHWERVNWSEEKSSEYRKNFLAKIDQHLATIKNFEKEAEIQEIYDFTDLKNELAEQRHLLVLKELVKCLPHKSSKENFTGSFFRETNEHTKSAIAGYSLLIASGALRHPQIQAPLAKIPYLITNGEKLGSELIDTYHRTLEENIRKVTPQVEALILEERLKLPGLMPVGGKVHVPSSIDPKMLDFISDLFGFESTPFQMIHAGKSLLLPPLPSAFEVGIFVQILQCFGALNPRKFDLQSCVAGQLNPQNAPIVGASMLLATDQGVHYRMNDLQTTHDQTGARIMAYDGGVKKTGLPFDLPQADGRTDILGRHSLRDLGLHQMLGTLLVHNQFGGMFENVGKDYAEAFSKILEKNQLLPALNQSAWVYDHANPDDTLDNHNSMLLRFTTKWAEDRVKQNFGIIREVYQLLRQKYWEIQQISRANIPETHPEYQKLKTF